MKSGGLDRNDNAIAEFRDAVSECKLSDLERKVSECKLSDLGSKRHPFTWSNRQFGPCHIEEKLDKFFCN